MPEPVKIYGEEATCRHCDHSSETAVSELNSLYQCDEKDKSVGRYDAICPKFKRDGLTPAELA